MELTDIIIRIRATSSETVSKAREDSVDDRFDEIVRTVSVDVDKDKNVSTRRAKIGRELDSKGPCPPCRPSSSQSGVVKTNSVKKETSDIDSYQHKKTLAQGMMDLALLSANANQLRYVLESYRGHSNFYPTVALIGTSIVLQVAVGVGLILTSRYNIKEKQEMSTANRINNFTTIGVFLVTLVNVFVCAIGVADSPDD